MEYAAKTSSPEKLGTGTTVEVVSVLTPTMLEVEPVDETVPSLSDNSGPELTLSDRSLEDMVVRFRPPVHEAADCSQMRAPLDSC